MILLAALIVAGAVCFTFRWSTSPIYGRVGIARLDRWTGRIVLCTPQGATEPSYFSCEPNDWERVKP